MLMVAEGVKVDPIRPVARQLGAPTLERWAFQPLVRAERLLVVEGVNQAEHHPAARTRTAAHRRSAALMPPAHGQVEAPPVEQEVMYTGRGVTIRRVAL